MFLFKPKKPEEEKKPEVSQANIDLEIITNMNQEFALSLELKETLNTALKVIIGRINAQAANIFLINEQKKKFECIASINQDYLDEYELDLTDGVMAKAVQQKNVSGLEMFEKMLEKLQNFILI